MLTNHKNVPGFEQMMLPQLKALLILNGKASVKSLDAKAIEIMRLPKSVTTVPHNAGKRTEVEYRLAWARTYLKKYGLIKNTSRGIWSVTTNFNGDIENLNVTDILKTVHGAEPDNAKIDSYEAFEMLVLNTLKDILKIQNKKIENAPPHIPCDFILPDGLSETDGPVYVETKAFLNIDAVTNTVLSINKYASDGRILLVFKSDLSAGQMKILYDKLKDISNMEIEIWDMHILMEKMNPDSDYIGYFINPQKTLIESAIDQSDESFKIERRKITDSLKQRYSEGI